MKWFLLISVFWLIACSDSTPDIEDDDDIVRSLVSVGESTELELIEKDKGIYTLSVKANTRYSIDVDNLSTSKNWVTALFGEEQKRVSRSTTVSFDYTALKDEDVFITIDGSSSSSFYYRVTPHLGTGYGLIHDDFYEPNNSKNAAFPIENGATYRSEMGPYDDFDWYSIDVVKGDIARFQAERLVSSTSTRIRTSLFSDNGNPLTKEFLLSEFLDESVEVTQTGKLYVLIKGEQPFLDYQYQFSVSLSGLQSE